MTKEWEDVKKPERFGQVKDTGVQIDVLKKIGTKICTLPEDWEFHSMVKKIYSARLQSVTEGKGIDMGSKSDSQVKMLREVLSPIDMRFFSIKARIPLTSQLTK
jgi:2-oxoglutarate dehydrogenase complex dehydrogenase (E1) component-like enzyme